MWVTDTLTASVPVVSMPLGTVGDAGSLPGVCFAVGGSPDRFRFSQW